MSFSTKITFVPRDNGEKSVSFNGIYFGLGTDYTSIIKNLENKFKELSFRNLNETSSYEDFVTVLSINEFKKFYKNLDSNDFYNYLNLDLDNYMNNNESEVRYNWVIIEINE